jgi:thiamine biosynthesis lipoprotein
MATVTLALHAMATRFELVLHGQESARLRAAGEEALAEIQRLEGQLSLFRPGSEISQLNARASREPVRVSPEVFSLLRHARQLSEETGGAFDITVAPLMWCWGFREGTGRVPGAEELAEARAKVGMQRVELDEKELTVRFAREGVRLDLGAIGKGYAIERAVELLREAGITSALCHGGTSTVYGMGHPPKAEAWKIAIDEPVQEGGRLRPRDERASDRADTPGRAPLATVCLRDEALSVSAVWGRSFEAGGKTYGHIIDPRTGRPANAAVLAAVALPSATETDALSTALLTVGGEGHDPIARLRPGLRTLVVSAAADGWRVKGQGIMASLGNGRHCGP